MVVVRLLPAVRPRRLQPNLLLVVHKWVSATANGQRIAHPLKPAMFALDLKLISRCDKPRPLVGIVVAKMLRDVVHLLRVEVIHRHFYFEILRAAPHPQGEEIPQNTAGCSKTDGR